MTNPRTASFPSSTRRGFLLFAATGTAALAAGCLPRPAPVTYDLSPAAVQAAARRTSRTVLIAEPEAIQTYDTDRIVAREPGGVLSYLPSAQWSDRLPRLVQTRMVQAFQDAGISNIGRTTDPLNPDRVLSSDIRAFEVDVSAGRLAVVSISVRLVDDWDRRIVASSAFTASVPVPGTGAAEAVPALNAALAQVLDQVIAWTVRNT
ncbi:ABC-type transport auxiliary lipoprotein family protein [Pelagibacterium limicola]|uniref:ABC-type transport auxiliary lipoprotein family protein n=1 Tax=Pelagibacterium limicola TaxID=2791022 RepID=UPI0018AF722F|nr:ABC-type transport auxiliary lipoprotein family protein [Pelagibacterium limicola]